MAHWTDYISLIITISVLATLAYVAFYVVKSVSKAVETTKESLQKKGVNISEHGMSVKTSKRLNHEDYVDATQRGFIKAVKASRFRHDAGDDASNKRSSPGKSGSD